MPEPPPSWRVSRTMHPSVSISIGERLCETHQNVTDVDALSTFGFAARVFCIFALASLVGTFLVVFAHVVYEDVM